MDMPIIPYLTLTDAAAAIDLYKEAFGAVENSRTHASEQDKRIIHACLTIGHGSVFLMDGFPEHSGRPVTDAPTNVSMVIQLATPPEVDALHARATAAGMTSTMPSSDQFWGARFACVMDRFGHSWMLNAPLAPPAA